jgi:hypothetical protein
MGQKYLKIILSVGVHNKELHLNGGYLRITTLIFTNWLFKNYNIDIYKKCRDSDSHFPQNLAMCIIANSLELSCLTRPIWKSTHCILQICCVWPAWLNKFLTTGVEQHHQGGKVLSCASIFDIKCNLCGKINKIKTSEHRSGKRGRLTYNINSRAVLGSFHAGIGNIPI